MTTRSGLISLAILVSGGWTPSLAEQTWGDVNSGHEAEVAGTGYSNDLDLTVLKEPSSPKIYVIVGGAKLWIHSPVELESCYGGWGAVRQTPDGSLTSIATVPRDRTLVKGRGPEVFVIQGGQRRHVPDPGTFESLGFDWSLIRTLCEAELNAIPLGAPLQQGEPVGSTPVCDPANTQLRYGPGEAERCFGAIGQACLSQAKRGAFQLPPMSWAVAEVATNCTISERVSVGSIIHDTCCRSNTQGLYCYVDPVNLRDETSNLPCHREWRKAVYDTLEGRSWLVNFGPYFQDNNGDDLTTSLDPTRAVVTYGPLGVQDAPVQSDVREFKATRRLSAPGGQKLEVGDIAFCASGRFREEGWCAPVPGNLACSGTAKLGNKSFPDWKREKQTECNRYWLIDPRKIGCQAHIAAEETTYASRNSHWGICQ